MAFVDVGKKYNNIIFEHNNNGVAKITLSREKTLNAINPAMVSDLNHSLEIFSKDASLKVLIVTGKGKGFCSGADLSPDEEKKQLNQDGVGETLNQVKKLIVKLCSMEKIVICQLNGVAAGAGFSFAMACDIRIAGESASCIASFIRIGVVPDAGLTYTLPRVVGTAKALEIFLFGEPINSKKALEWGIVNKVVPDAQLEKEVLDLAIKMAAGPTQSYGWIKSMTFSTDSLSDKYDKERDNQVKAFQSPHYRELVAKFQRSRSKL